MVRRYSSLETPTTPAITNPILLRQMEAESPPSVSCGCGESIDARHLERHQRSKKHRVQLDWYRTQMLVAYAEQQVNARNQQPITA
jgi:hypothetical protein